MSVPLSNSEKLAFVKMVDTIINADEVIHDAEIEIMSQLMQRFEFDSEFVAKAKEEKIEDVLPSLRLMPNEKKRMIVRLLNAVAMSDGFVHQKEMTTILDYCKNIGLNKEIR